MAERNAREEAVTNWLCPSCGYDGFKTYGEVKTPSGSSPSMLWFCPVCKTALDRQDALGEIEVELRGDDPPLTFQDVLDRPDTMLLGGEG